MSHFAVLVVEDTEKTLEDQMAPFHEFECTGVNDEYVQDIDTTQELRDEFENQEDPDYPTFQAFAIDYHGSTLLNAGEDPDLEGEHKFGYCQVDTEGNVVKIIRRTNPNRKWDWYQVGGRWSGFLELKNGGKADSARICDIDFYGMRERSAEAAAKRYDAVHAVIAGRTISTWDETREKYGNVEDARTAYHGQQVMLDLRASKTLDFFESVEGYACERETFIHQAREGAVTLFALLKDDVWQERGTMHMFGIASNEKDGDLWNSQVTKVLSELPDDTVITVVDCHI